MTMPIARFETGQANDIESAYAWGRLVVSLVLSTIGGVALVVNTRRPADCSRPSSASTEPPPRCLTPRSCSALSLAARRWAGSPTASALRSRRRSARRCSAPASLLSSQAAAMWQFTLVHGVLIGDRRLRQFRPVDRRHLAVVLAAPRHCGRDLRQRQLSRRHDLAAGHPASRRSVGWRSTYFGIGIFCLATMLPLALVLRRPRAGAAETVGRVGVPPARRCRTA